MSKFWKILLFFLATGFLTENMGFFTHQLNLAAGIVFLFFFTFLYLPKIELMRKIKKPAILGLIFLTAGFVLLRYDIIVRILGFSIFLFGLYLFLRSVGREERELPALLVTLLCFAFYMILYQYTPFLWYPLNSFSLSISGVVSYLTRKDILLSVTFTGIHLTVLFAFFFIISYLFSEKRRICSLRSPTTSSPLDNPLTPFIKGEKGGRGVVGSLCSPTTSSYGWHLLLFCSSLILANILYVAFFAYLPVFLHSFPSLIKSKIFSYVSSLPPPIIEKYVSNLPIFAFTFLLIPFSVYIRKMEFRPVEIVLRKLSIKLVTPFLLIVALSVGVLTVNLPLESIIGREVVFYEKGFLNWNTPTFGEYGSLSSGMFGNLPAFVNLMGLKSRRISEINANSLKGAKVLVLINIEEKMHPSEIEAVWEFVRNGGSLLMLGDHTFLGEDKKNWLNEILKPVNIRYNFDSADFFIGGWLHSYSYAKHPITYHLGDEQNEAGIVVGASLQLKYPAAPLIYGKYGYSDAGNPLSPAGSGYLGNLQYDMSEQLGDVVLAAEQQYGKGKVVVLGDTSGFANSILINTHPFINRVFTWLASDRGCKDYLPRFSIAIILIILAIAASRLFALHFDFLKAGNDFMTLIFCVPIILFFVALAPLIGSWKMEQPLKGKLAYVDSSHLERFSLESWREDGTMGLYLNLMRNGYLSFQLQDFTQKKIANSKLLFLLAPTKKFTSSEVKMLKNYVENGGILFLTVGWEERSASVPLLKAFNFKLDPTPLGHFKMDVPNTQETVMFYEAWSIYPDGGDVEIVCSYDKRPLITIKKYGKGKFVCIGDTYFFFNKNLEMEEIFYKDNINFFKWLLGKLQVSSN